jgi:hypothetical protein
MTTLAPPTLTPTVARRPSVFDHYIPQAWPYRFEGTIAVDTLCGGIPSDPNVAEGWIRGVMGDSSDVRLQQQVAEVMAQRALPETEAIEEVNRRKHLNGFKRDEVTGELYIDGRQLKSAIKEAAMICVATEKIGGRGWGKTNKGLKSFLAEHVEVVDHMLMTGRFQPSGVNQRFVQTFRGTGIQYEEYLREVELRFTVITDYDFDEKTWAMIWLTGGMVEGIGATRSQGFGRYALTDWRQVAAG